MLSVVIPLSTYRTESSILFCCALLQYFIIINIRGKLHYTHTQTHTHIQHGQLTEMVTWAENWDFVGQLNKRKTHLARKDPASDTLSIVAEFCLRLRDRALKVC